jgi:hypothetical protein
MKSIDRILEQTNSMLLIDWPGEHCPCTLLRAGYVVFGHDPQGYARYELHARKLVTYRLSDAPRQVDLAFCYRPLDELSECVATAQKVGAKVFWYQSGFAGPSTEYCRGVWLPDDMREKARRLVEKVGLVYVDEVYIADAVEALDICKPRHFPEAAETAKEAP